jgi:trigger factor
LALVEGCRHALEISVPATEVEAETGRVTGEVQKLARLPGFRPGKAPAGIVRKQFSGDIRERVLKALVPKYLQQKLEEENLHMVGTPGISDVHFHDGEPLRFKVEFEVLPQIELQEYKGIEVPYDDPVVTDQDVDERLDGLREEKAQYVNIDPRAIEDGDYAVVALESISGVAGEPVKQDEIVLHVGSQDTVPAFTENLRGRTPGEELEFDVPYPEDYASARLAGNTVRFRARIKGIRRKELPEINDEFAQDMGDFRTVEELRDALRKSILAQRQFLAQQEAKNKLIDKLVDAHEFPVPEVFIERQMRSRLEQEVRSIAEAGVDPRTLKFDKEEQRDKAIRDVKASLLLDKVADREGIAAMRDEVDREVERIAKQKREMVAAVRMRFEKDGTLNRIASHIQTEKTLNFLFEHASKTALT